MFKKLVNFFRTNNSESIEGLQRRIEQGDAEAMYLLGRIYHIGELIMRKPWCCIAVQMPWAIRWRQII